MSLRLKRLALLMLCLAAAGCGPGVAGARPGGQTHADADRTGPLTLEIAPDVLRAGVKRMGINLGGQNFYDSGQMLRNLTFRNPGFEGGTWQSILHCKAASATLCTDGNPYTVWPAGFLEGARFEVLSGRAEGATGSIVHSSAAQARPETGVTLTFAQPVPALAAGDFLLVRLDKPGHAEAGWWIESKGGASIATETRDLSPHTRGRQALRIDATTGTTGVHSYFDSMAGRSFVQLHGRYSLGFRARLLAGSPALHVSLTRLDTQHGLSPLLDRTLSLTRAWKDYRIDFTANDRPGATGTVDLNFAFAGTSALLDDVSLVEEAAPDNPTAFRNAVVETLRALHPGILRYMDSGTNFGASLDTMLAVPEARERAGASTQATVQEDIAIGLEEFLVLTETVGAEPWYTLPAGTSPEDARRLVEFLAGPASSAMGQVRARLGHPAAWTSSFPAIHLELGNEQWNAASFAGATLPDPTVYGHRADTVFRAARSSPWFLPARFDLVLGTWNGVPWWTRQELAASHAQDSVAIAPYLFAEFNDASSDEAIFGPMLAQPEALDSRAGGLVYQQMKAAHPTRLAVYEVNLGTMATTSAQLTQADLDRSVPSLGAGLAVADHMLRMLRDNGVIDDCLFSLPEFSNGFSGPGPRRDTPLWGAVVDMGGRTSLRRPQFLALQAIDRAILPNLLATRITGRQPMWDQPRSANDKIELAGAHGLDAYAFADGSRRSLILFNLMRTQTVPVALPQLAAGQAFEETLLDAPQITSTNEHTAEVTLTTVPKRAGPDSSVEALPPHSMTVLTWTVR